MKKCIFITIFLIVFSTCSFSDLIGEIDFNVGQKKDLDAYVVENASVTNEHSVYWSTNDSSIATVDSDGVVTARKAGRTFITATDKSEKAGKSLVIFISVANSISSIEFINSKLAMIVGDEITPMYNLELMNESIKEYNSNVKFRTMNKDIVKVLDNKLVAMKPGDVRVHAFTEDGNKSDFVDIVVKDKYEEISIVNLKNYATLFVGEKFDVIVEDENGNVISSGLDFSVTKQANFLGNGEFEVMGSTGDFYSQVKVSTKSGKSDYINLKFDNLVQKVKVDKERAIIDSVGEEITLKAKLIPKYDDKEPILTDVKWTSSNNSIASVKAGIVRGIRPGIVRITATSKDGGFTDSSSVEVDPESIDDYVIKSYIKDIEFDILSDTYTIGDEIPLVINYSPINAEANDFKFYLSKGGSDQIFEEDGQYYFKPKYEGKYKITLKTESDIEKSINVDVKNNLKSISMNLELDIKKNNRYVVYYGETNKVYITYSSIIESLGVSDKEYVLKSLNGKVSFNSKSDYDFDFTTKSLGTESIIIESKYSGKQYRINLIIEPLISKISVDQEIRVNIGEKFSPIIDYQVLDNERGYTEPLDKKIKIIVVSNNIPVEYINNEINYEIESISDLRQLIKLDHGKRDVIEDEIAKRIIRKSHFEQSLKRVVKGYYRFTNLTLLTDRTGQKIKVANISNESIVGLFKGFIEYRVVTNDNEKSALGKVYFMSEIDDFVVTSSDGIVSSTEKNLSSEINRKIEIEFAEKMKHRFGSSSGFDIPSENLIVSILEFESEVKLDEALKHSYNRYVSREDAYKMFISIISSKTDYSTKKIYFSVFIDDNSGIANEAYNLGLINLSADRKAYPYELLSFEEFKILVSRFERVMEVKLAKEAIDKNEIERIVDFDTESDTTLNLFRESDKISLENIIIVFLKILKE